MYKHAEFYKMGRDGWFMYSAEKGEKQDLAPTSWNYIKVLDFLSSAEWEFVGSRVYGGMEYFVVRKKVD